MGFLLLFFFASFSSLKGVTFCEEGPFEAKWPAWVTSNDGFGDVTLDCKNSKDPVNLWNLNLFRENTASITIKNCCKLSLRGEPNLILPHFKILKIVNVSELLIPKSSLYRSPCLPSNVILENVRQINFLDSSYHIQGCDGSTVKSLVLKNISINILSEEFTAAFGNNLSNLEMENIQIEQGKRDYNSYNLCQNHSNYSDEVIEEKSRVSGRIGKKSEAYYKLIEGKSEVFEDYNLDGKANHHELGPNHYNHSDEVIKKELEQIQSYYLNNKSISLLTVGLIITSAILGCIICIVWYKKLNRCCRI